MSGAAQKAKNVVKPVAEIAWDYAKAPYVTLPNMVKSLAQGEGVGGSLKAGGQAQFGSSIDVTKQTIGALKGKPDEIPNIAGEQEDPAVVQAKAEEERRRAKREEEINILTNKPGRGGTILTDRYTYKV